MSQINARLVYRNAFKSMQRAGVDPSKAILSQSFLRLERVAATNVTNYQFGVLLNDTPQGASVRSTETRLQLQDAFYVSQVQVYFALASSATATDYIPSFFPNPNNFTTAGAAAALGQLYNSTMSLSVNNRTIVTNWDVMRHYESLQTQTTATNTLTDQKNLMSTGSSVCEPNWVLIGSKNNQLQIQLPSAIGTLEAGKTTVIGVLMRGVLAQNCTVVS